jgi:hypothetical protein
MAHKYRIEIAGWQLQIVQSALEAYENFYQGRHKMGAGIISVIAQLEKARGRYELEQKREWKRGQKQRWMEAGLL